MRHAKSRTKKSLAKLFSEFEFSSLLQEIKRETKEPAKDCKLVLDKEALAELVSRLQDCREISFEVIWEKNPSTDLIGIALGTGSDAFYIPLGHTNAKEQLKEKEVLAALAPVLQ